MKGGEGMREKGRKAETGGERDCVSERGRE